MTAMSMKSNKNEYIIKKMNLLNIDKPRYSENPGFYASRND